MKQEFKTNELRQTAESIRDAVLAKSITPDMVGGTMLALVNASGEVIEALGNLESERVTVKVQGYNGQSRVDITGAKVYLDQFSIGGVPTVSVPRQEFEVDENGEVTFEVIKGYQYTVFSKLEGMAASFQFAYEACLESRTIELWHFPVGVWMLGASDYANYETEAYREVPLISSSFMSEIPEELLCWDIRDDEESEGGWLDKIMVATAETTFAIEQNTKSSDYLTWAGNRYYGKAIPTMPLIFPDMEKFDNYDDAWNDAVERARSDFDGALNTAKILAFCKSAPAAEFCTDSQADYVAQRFLPSAGQLYLIYLNRSAIEALASAANDEAGMEFLLPSKDYDWYWSSTQYDEWCAWSVYMYDGGTYCNGRFGNGYVRAVSAFHFKY